MNEREAVPGTDPLAVLASSLQIQLRYSDKLIKESRKKLLAVQLSHMDKIVKRKMKRMKKIPSPIER